MIRLFCIIFIIISVRTDALAQNVLVDIQLKATAQEFVLDTHPDKFTEEAFFDIPGAGTLRITYIDASFNTEADSGGLSWRHVPGATTYSKIPGREINVIREPSQPISGASFKLTIESDIEGPMKNVGVVLTPRHRGTWSYGGYQYMTNLNVKVEWSPQRSVPTETPADLSGNSNQYTGTWTAYVPAKNWSHGGYQIIQNGQDLVYVVYSGERHTGRVLSEGAISYVEANETGKVSRDGKRIDWSNWYWTKD